MSGLALVQEFEIERFKNLNRSLGILSYAYGGLGIINIHSCKHLRPSSLSLIPYLYAQTWCAVNLQHQNK
jgi:hypothetical protein